MKDHSKLRPHESNWTKSFAIQLRTTLTSLTYPTWLYTKPGRGENDWKLQHGWSKTRPKNVDYGWLWSDWRSATRQYRLSEITLLTMIIWKLPIWYWTAITRGSSLDKRTDIYRPSWVWSDSKLLTYSTAQTLICYSLAKWLFKRNMDKIYDQGWLEVWPQQWWSRWTGRYKGRVTRSNWNVRTEVRWDGSLWCTVCDGSQILYIESFEWTIQNWRRFMFDVMEWPRTSESCNWNVRNCRLNSLYSWQWLDT